MILLQKHTHTYVHIHARTTTRQRRCEWSKWLRGQMNSIEEKDVGQPSYFHFPPSFTLLLLPGNFLSLTDKYTSAFLEMLQISM